MNAYEKGIDNIKKLVDNFKWPLSQTIIVEGLRNFGDTLHSSLVVRQLRKTYPRHMIAWGISDRYYKQFNEYAEAVGVVVFPLPHEATPEDRQNWKKHCEGMKFAKTCFPLCAVSGWNIGGNIVDNVLHNAGIKNLSVPRRPYLPNSQEDYAWHDRFCVKHGLRGKQYVVLEYNSYTLSKPPHEVTWSVEKYNELVKHLKWPVVWTAAKDDPALDGGIDARGITWRQAKVMIERSGCMVGCGSGLGVLSACDGLNTYVIEINIGEPLTLANNYGIKSVSTKTDNPIKIAAAVNKYIDQLQRTRK